MSLELGVNLAGADFGSAEPGVFGKDYTFPTDAELDYYASKGMTIIRLPIKWERIQDGELGPLDPANLARMDQLVQHAAADHLQIIIDIHNYAQAFGADIGTSQTTNADFADLWGKLAAHYAKDPNVVFGLMNEPHDQTATQWLVSVNTAIAAIRAAGATQEILVPGTDWTGAWTWTTSQNAAVIGTGVQDPLHNFAFEVHQYLDSDGSGTHNQVVSADIGVQRLTAITQWAEATGNKLFLGEFGVGTDPTSLAALNNMLNYMNQHTSVWQGGTYWAGGPWWGNSYWGSVEPTGLGTSTVTDKPQMAILEQYAGTGVASPPPPPPQMDDQGTLTETSDSASGFIVGAHVTAHLTDATGVQAGTEHYQWLLDGNPIAGATAQTYQLTSAEVGHQVEATVTYTDGLGIADAVAASQFAVIAASPPPTLALPVGGETLIGTNPTFNKLVGGAGNDLLIGDLIANNVLLGGAGNDTINGGNNTNWIDGGPGADILSGNRGKTTFVEAAHNANGDVITDFVSGQDNIQAPGYGAGGHIVQLDATHWQLISATGLIHDTLTLTNGAIIHPADIHFS